MDEYEKLEKELKFVIEDWCTEFDIEKDWEDDLHIADVLDKHIFRQMLDWKHRSEQWEKRWKEMQRQSGDDLSDVADEYPLDKE